MKVFQFENSIAVLTYKNLSVFHEFKLAINDSQSVKDDEKIRKINALIKNIKDKKGSEKDYDVVILALTVMLTTLTCLKSEE